MIALTIRQPKASLLAVGAASLLTSHRFTTHRGPIAIYADWWFPPVEQMQLKQKRVRNALCDHYTEDDLNTGQLPTGVVIAVSVLTACYSTNDLDRLPPRESDEFFFSDFSADRFVWRFDETRKLEIPMRTHGQRGFWKLPEHIAERLEVFV